jgi:hypothetical protein
MLFYVSILAFVALFLMRTSYSAASIGPCESPNFATVLYRYRAHLPVPERLQGFVPSFSRENYAPLSTFADQAAAGLTSSTFDLEGDNIFQGDARVGLDELGTQEVMEIMRRENVKYASALFVVLVLTLLSCLSFDRARLIRHHRYLAANGIDPSGKSYPNPVHGYSTAFLAGMPLNAKAITRL